MGEVRPGPKRRRQVGDQRGCAKRPARWRRRNGRTTTVGGFGTKAWKITARRPPTHPVEGEQIGVDRNGGWFGRRTRAQPGHDRQAASRQASRAGPRRIARAPREQIGSPLVSRTPCPGKPNSPESPVASAPHRRSAGHRRGGPQPVPAGRAAASSGTRPPSRETIRCPPGCARRARWRRRTRRRAWPAPRSVPSAASRPPGTPSPHPYRENLKLQ